MVKAPVSARRHADEHLPGRGNRAPFGRIEDVKRSGGKKGTAAMTDLLAERRIVIPAGVPWFA